MNISPDTRLYYVEAYSELSQCRERISAYCTSPEVANQLKETLPFADAEYRLYLYPTVKSCRAADVIQKQVF